jgi:hypothetical protein
VPFTILVSVNVLMTAETFFAVSATAFVDYGLAFATSSHKPNNYG